MCLYLDPGVSRSTMVEGDVIYNIYCIWLVMFVFEINMEENR